MPAATPNNNNFIFRNGKVAHNIEELVHLCEQYTEDGIYFLMRQDFEKWLDYIGKNQLALLVANIRQDNLINDDHRLQQFVKACNEALAKDFGATITLENRDYTLIIDKSGSMSTKDQQNGKSRWEVMQESTYALASKCEEFDPDGITIYTFSSQFRRYDNVTANKVEQVFKENEPMGRTEMAEVLQDALENYFKRKQAGQTKPNGETILVVTDGQPDDQKAVSTTIVEATKRMDRDEELAISFIQIGHDKEATAFLKLLDDELISVGAKFDIVDTITIEEIEEQDVPLKEILIRAIID